ncbi:MAG: PQQ-binding-like beta-propeller repeat protein, partial [Thermoleophilia bacterium]|nr:PQQ-binding-like beta-propeller repeat protein [Thermoleophilia bacterium]
GTIYFGSEDQHLYALSPGGDLKWSVPLPLGTGASVSPAIGSDGTVYIGGDGLHAVDASGRLRWSYPGPNPRSGTALFMTPVVAVDGSIYVGGRNLYALAPDGTLKWEYPTRLPSLHTIVGLDGTVLATANDSTLYAIVERGR